MDNWENGIKVDDDITAKHQLEHFMDVFVDHFEEKKEKFEKLYKLTKQWKTVVDRFSQIKISLENAVEMESNNCEQLSMEPGIHRRQFSQMIIYQMTRIGHQRSPTSSKKSLLKQNSLLKQKSLLKKL
jgi:hypothetical protein